MIGSVPLHIIKEVSSLDLFVKNAPNEEINNLLNQTLLLGGKRLRPLLTYLMSEFYELDLSEMGLFARAIEHTHSATLAHDDVIDDAKERRGNPSINVVSSNKKAILSGDYLLAQTMAELAATGDVRYITELSRVLQELVDGEWLQMQNSFTSGFSREVIEKIALKKTASAISWCCVIPSIKANQSEEVIELSRKFGLKFGIAFQEIDDVIDFQTSSLKDRFQDAKNGVLNSVLFELFELDEDAKNKIISNPSSIEEISSRESFMNACKIVQNRAQDRINSCKEDLELLQKLTFHGESKRSNKAHKTINTLLDALATRDN